MSPAPNGQVVLRSNVSPDVLRVNQTAMKPKREEGPGWGPGLLNSAWWEHAPCVGGFKIRGWAIPGRIKSAYLNAVAAGATSIGNIVCGSRWM